MFRAILATVLIVTSSCSTRPDKYLALGDSYTIGESVSEADRWPMQLAAKLNGEGVDLGTPRIIARTGWTTADLLAAMDHASLQPHYDWVTLMIGVNDQFQHRPVEAFRKDLDTLLDRSIHLAGDAKHVIVISIPDWSVTPFAAGSDRSAIAKQIDTFNAAVVQECEQRRLVVVDVTDISRRAADDASLIAEDGLHPSPAMYRLWVERMTPAILRVAASH